jgi:hypothetical protein
MVETNTIDRDRADRVVRVAENPQARLGNPHHQRDQDPALTGSSRGDRDHRAGVLGRVRRQTRNRSGGSTQRSRYQAGLRRRIQRAASYQDQQAGHDDYRYQNQS